MPRRTFTEFSSRDDVTGLTIAVAAEAMLAVGTRVLPGEHRAHPDSTVTLSRGRDAAASARAIGKTLLLRRYFFPSASRPCSRKNLETIREFRWSIEIP
jgi:hypothetical protein